MERFKTRYVILISILGIFVLAVFFVKYKRPQEKTNIDISTIPWQVNGWQAEEVGVDTKTKDILETESVLVRKYSKGKHSVWLSVVYYKDSRVALHLPESCSIGSGSFIISKDREKISVPGEKDFYANKLVLKGDKGNQVIIYYFETDKLRTSSYQAMRWQMIKNKLKAKSNSGALVRFSALIEENPEKTTRTLKEFIRESSPLLTKHMF